MSQTEPGASAAQHPTPAPSNAGATPTNAGAGVPVGGSQVSSGAQNAARAAYASGARGQALVIAVAIAGAESRFVPTAHCLNCAGVPEDSQGLWQINLDAHPEFRTVNLYDATANGQAAASVSNGWTNFHPWSTYTSGLYLAWWPVAAAAAHAIEGGAPLTPPPINAGGLANAAVGASNAASAAVSGVTSVGSFLGSLSSPHTWYRVVLVVGGAAAVIAGVVMLDKSVLGAAGAGTAKAAGGGVIGSVAAHAVGV
jgi:hypothetical protein